MSIEKFNAYKGTQSGIIYSIIDEIHSLINKGILPPDTSCKVIVGDEVIYNNGVLAVGGLPSEGYQEDLLCQERIVEDYPLYPKGEVDGIVNLSLKIGDMKYPEAYSDIPLDEFLLLIKEIDKEDNITSFRATIVVDVEANKDPIDDGYDPINDGCFGFTEDEYEVLTEKEQQKVQAKLERMRREI